MLGMPQGRLSAARDQTHSPRRLCCPTTPLPRQLPRPPPVPDSDHREVLGRTVLGRAHLGRLLLQPAAAPSVKAHSEPSQAVVPLVSRPSAQALPRHPPQAHSVPAPALQHRQVAVRSGSHPLEQSPLVARHSARHLSVRRPALPHSGHPRSVPSLRLGSARRLPRPDQHSAQLHHRPHLLSGQNPL